MSKKGLTPVGQGQYDTDQENEWTQQQQYDQAKQKIEKRFYHVLVHNTNLRKIIK